MRCKITYKIQFLQVNIVTAYSFVIDKKSLSCKCCNKMDFELYNPTKSKTQKMHVIDIITFLIG